MKKIAITGGIATGKSSLCKWLVQEGYPVIDCDALVHDSYESEGELYQAVVEAFSVSVLDENGKVDRKKLSQIVFSSAADLEKLNAVTHPIVRHMVNKQVGAFFKKGHSLVFVDVPLLFEASLQEDYDLTVLVDTTEALQLKRLILRNGYDLEEAKKRIQSQMPLSQKRELADYRLDNSKGIEAIENEALAMIKWLKEKI